ncbi:glycoside hydrolase family 28 protein [Streptomyces paludis]|uniref:Polygalacturonase n=1 Tax=Streptomyces paludis TaxID=2282738 RepID=A0A345HP10_9ACTN|nr:glycosyl hydrolase family 28 protein [Streptomyces paludis]AXG78434.1 polygalacturonase [Streptomyces paludis]
MPTTPAEPTPSTVPAPAPTKHRRRKITRTKVAVSAALAAGVAGGVLVSANAATTAAAALPASATGDSRTVVEPKVPSTVCKTLTAGLSMTSRKSDAAKEAAPPDTARIQAALDACKQSGTGTVAVKLTASTSTSSSTAAKAAFLTGPVTVPQGVVLLLDTGVTLYGSLNAADYQVTGKPTCGTVTTDSGGCKALITVSGANAGVESVRASGGAQGTIDGRGDMTLYGKSVTWWALATQAKTESRNQNNPRMIQAVKANNFTLYNINLVNSANFHVSFQNATGFTAWGVRIKTPATARNTDGIDPAGATDVTIANSYVMTGDDGVAIKGGSAASKNITVKNSHFYGTHGISIGSETTSGVSNVLVSNNTITGTDTLGNASASSVGLRVKSSAANGGKVSQVTYLSNCITKVKQPLVFDTRYSGGTGSSVPFFTGILVNGVRSTASTANAKSVLTGYDAARPLGLTLANVSLDTTALTASYASVGLYNTNLTPSGTGVTTSTLTGSGTVPTCTFPSYPAL